MRSKKLLICLVFLFVSLFAFGFNAKVNAIETSELIKVEGAQVRTTGNAGIRFVATEAYEGENETYGILLAFGKAEADENFVVGGTVNGKVVANAQVATAEGTFAATLYDIPEVYYTQVISARAYVKAGETYVYSSTVCVKSLAEVVLKAKNDFAEGEIIDNVVAALANTKKTFSDANNNFYVDSALYETNYAKLAVEFIKDWNKVMETSLDAATCFASGSAGFLSSARGNTPTESGLYKFFSDETYGAKWAWFLDFLYNTGTNSAGKSQIKAIKEADDSLNSDTWYYGINASSFIGSTFLAKKLSYGAGNIDYTSNQALLGNLAVYNTSVYADLAGCELVKVEDTITLPAFTPNNGYAASFINDSTSYEIGQEYAVTAENKMFVATNTAIVYPIELYWDGDLINEDVYTIETGYTLSDFSFPGYAFEGWYDNEEFTGSAVTEIAKGSTGKKVFYAKMTEGETVEVTLEYMDGYASAAELVAAFVADVQEYSTNSNEVNFMTTASHSYAKDYVPFKSAMDNSDGTFGAKWANLFILIAEAHNTSYSSAIKNLANEVYTTDAIYLFLQELKGFRDGILATAYSANVQQYDWSTDEGGHSAKILAAVKTETTTTSMLVDADLPTPVCGKDGYTFAGWYTNAEYSGEVVTIVPAEDVTLYAKWEAVTE